MTEHNYIKELFSLELTEREEEGCDVENIKSQLNECENNPEKLKELYQKLISLPICKSFPYEETDNQDELLNYSGKKDYKGKVDVAEKRFSGAWLGRCIGCALGKPLETSPFTSGENGIAGWKFVYEWFKGADAYPIKNYVPSFSSAEKELDIHIEPGSSPSYKENISFMQTDDDVRYMVLSLLILEKYGIDFSVKNVADTWQTYLPVNMLFTAERQAYLNTCNAEIMFEETKEKYDYIRMHHNPYREWIGAQIRIDVYAYACAGNPQKAATLAYKDASFSHSKNGIYGAMFCSGMIAAAFTQKDVESIVEAGLSVIPSNCRLYHAIRKACEIAKNAKDELELVEKINNEFSSYHPVHTINNAAMCAASIIYGQGDFEKSVTTAVLGGWDTDCNGATVGSVLGAFLGSEGIDEKWSSPLNDTLYSSIPDFHPIKISECAERTLNLWLKFN